MKNERNPKVLLWGTIMSALLIAFFFTLQTYELEGLNLNYQWILIVDTVIIRR